MTDRFPELAASYVYDLVHDNVHNIRTESMQGIPTSNLKKTIGSVEMTVGGKPKRVNPIDIWLKLPSCVQVMGEFHDPTSSDKIVLHREELYVNNFHMPHYDQRQIDEEKVAPFKQYLEYLIPDADERGYFIKWLAAKVQFRDYRGPAVVMIAEQEGTGRNTLMQMIGSLFGDHNVQDVKLQEFEKPSFNEYMDKLFVYVDETIAHQDQRERARFYEHIKSTVDPLAQRVTINRKYGGKSQAMSVTSFLFFSNNADAMHVSNNSRRIFALSNTDLPGDASHFRAVHEWMEKDDWQIHVWNWLMSIEVDKGEMSQRPPVTEAMEEMRDAAKTSMDRLIEVAIAVWPSDIVNSQLMVETLLARFEHKLPKYASADVLRRELRRRLSSLDRLNKTGEFRNRIRTEGKTRVVAARDPELMTSGALCEDHAMVYKDFIKGMTDSSFAQIMREYMTENAIEV
jgi:hypothetical protein